MSEYDVQRARKERDQGIQRVLVFDDVETWRADYRIAVEQWFTTLPVGSTFVGEGLRRVAQNAGLREPHHPNVWGANSSAFIRRWLREQFIGLEGTASAHSVASHAHCYRQYRKLK